MKFFQVPKPRRKLGLGIAYIVAVLGIFLSFRAYKGGAKSNISPQIYLQIIQPS